MNKFVQSFFFEKNFFPVVYSVNARNHEELRRYFYIYDYNKFFGTPQNLLNYEGPTKTIFFYVTNLSKTYNDYVFTLDDIESKYFLTNELTHRLINDAKQFFNRANIDVNSNGVFWTSYLKLLSDLYSTILVNYLKFYLSFVRGKVNALYFSSLKESSCSDDQLSQLELYLSSIRKKFLGIISINENKSLANFFSGYYSALFEDVIDIINPYITNVNIPDLFSFFDIYAEADNNANPISLQLNELEGNFRVYDELTFKQSVSSVLSPDTIHFANISSIIGAETTNAFFKYLQT